MCEELGLDPFEQINCHRHDIHPPWAQIYNYAKEIAEPQINIGGIYGILPAYEIFKKADWQFVPRWQSYTRVACEQIAAFHAVHKYQLLTTEGSFEKVQVFSGGAPTVKGL